MIIIGHRGAAGLAPENTLQSFAAGIQAGAEWIELDIRCSKDGQAMVIHDPTTARTFGKDYPVATTHSSTLHALGVPTLEEAIKAITGKAKINIEIKSPDCEQAVVEALQKLKNYNQIMIASFSKAILRKIHALDQKIPLALLQHVNICSFLTLPFVSAVGFRHFLAPRLAVSLAKKHGLITYAYTVDSPKRAKQLVQKGFDGIVTNRPDILKPGR